MHDIITTTLVLLLLAKHIKSCGLHSTSPTCQQLHQIELALDESVDPCEDFYGHTCNNWALAHSSTEYSTAVGEVDYQTNLKLIAVMQSLDPASLLTANQNIFNKTYIYYKACIKGGLRNISSYLEIIKPGKDVEWPVMELVQAYRRGETNFTLKEWPGAPFNVFALLGQLRSYGLSEELLYYTMFSYSQTTMADIRIPYQSKPSTLALPQVVALLRDLGLPENAAITTAKAITETEELWHSVYEKYALMPTQATTYPIYYREARRKYPFLQIYFDNIQAQLLGDYDNVALHREQYLTFLLDKQWSAKEAQDLCNYLMIKLLMHLSSDKVSHFTKLECIKDVRNKLDVPANLLYYQHIYKPEELNYNRDINVLFAKARDYLLATLEKNRLNFHRDYVEQLRPDLSAIRLNLGNLPRNLHSKQIEKLFGDIPDLDLHNYYRNHLHLLRHRILQSLHLYRNQTYSPVAENGEGSSSTPHYDAAQGMLVLPLGILQPPIYHHTFDGIFKWSMLGYQMARELAQVPYWVTLIFTTCLSELGSVETAIEMSAAQAAYAAYIGEQSKQLQPEFSSMSWQKLFFLNLAQLFCTKDVPSRRAEYAERVHRLAMNLDSFAEAFQCSVGSKMNPKEKCRPF